MFRRIILIGGAGIVGAATLAVVQIRIGALFGISAQLDAFFVGAALPSVLLAIGAAAISMLVVPRLPSGDPAATAAAAGRMAVRATLIGVATTAFVVAAAPLIVEAIAPGLEPPTAADATRVLRIYSLSIPGTAAAFAYSSYGYASGRIWASGLSTAAYALTWLGLLFLPPFTGDVESAALAGLLATGVQVASAYLLASSGGLPRPRPTFSGLGIGREGAVAIAAVLGAAIIARAGLVLDPLFGSFLSVGSVSELSYAARIASLAILVCGQGAAFGLLIAGREPGESAREDSRVGVVAPLLFSTSAAVVLLVAGPPLSELILARGELSEAAAREVGELLRLWAPAVIAFSLVWVLEAMLYAEQRTMEVLTRGLAGLAVNAAASVPLVIALGVEGRPLGVLCGVAVQLGLQMRLFWGDPRFAALRSTGARRLIGIHAAGVAVVGSAAYLLFDAAGLPDVGALAAVAVTGGISVGALRRHQAAERARTAQADPGARGGGPDGA